MDCIFRLLSCMLTCFIAIGAVADNTVSPKTEKGVSLQLARERAATVSNINYELHFSIPEYIDMPVVGDAVIRFDYSGSGDLQLDFQSAAGNLPKTISINGKTTKTQYENEHIIISRNHLLSVGNTVAINGFVADDKTLNRHEDYLYTLFVPDRARSVFPCFDQPDMKARFTLTLTIPQGWKAISNAPMESESMVKAFSKRKKVKPQMHTVCRYGTSDPLPTYLFSFTAGVFESQTVVEDGYEIEGLYRRQTAEKEAQLSTVFSEIAHSIKWLEQYTGIRQPFRKYGFVVLPGYQFGGMEHPGAIQLNELRIFLRNNPTDDEELSRLNLIAHETSHLWFGDLVTMKWFDDVWTKEVFANFMADKIARQQFPDINHKLSFIKTHYPLALATDRTSGTHPIQQPLENLNRAGLLYGNIIYHKAPIMMQKLEELIGEDALRRGLQAYLANHAYGNATWDDLIACFEKESPDSRVSEFSRVWVKESGLPTIAYDKHTAADNTLPTVVSVSETDDSRRNLHWQQTFSWGLADIADGKWQDVSTQTVDMQAATTADIHAGSDSGKADVASIPNINGDGYGRFVLAADDARHMLSNWHTLADTQRLAAIMTLYENYLMHRISADSLFDSLSSGLLHEDNQLVASMCISYCRELLPHLDDKARLKAETSIISCATNHPLPSLQMQAKRIIGNNAATTKSTYYVYKLWKEHDDAQLSERDYMEMSYHLAQLLPHKYDEICQTQRSRLSNDDLKAEYDFVVRACHPDSTSREQLFLDLLKAENRRTEPYAAAALRLLNSETYEPQSNKYIVPALDILEEIQRTGDIFFPSDWLSALLEGHHSQQAKDIVRQWTETHQLPAALQRKLNEKAYHLMQQH